MANDNEREGVKDLDTRYRGPLTPNTILYGAIRENLQSVTVVGRDADGRIYVASNMHDHAHVSWELRQAEDWLRGK